MFFNLKTDVDWILFFSALTIVGAGLITMNSFVGENYFFEKQLIWSLVSVFVFFLFSFFDFSFLKQTKVLIFIFSFFVLLLSTLFFRECL